MVDEFKELNKIADEECSCTPKQRTGEDSTLCINCMASGALNTVYEIARQEYRDIMRIKGKKAQE